MKKLREEVYQSLISLALEARKNAYAPYSHFQVGAALLCRNGKIYQGCNVENASYGASNCAERTAFFKAVSEGEREFTALAIVGGPENAESLRMCSPCGICRQVMAEFCDRKAFEIILAASETDYQVYSPEELLPLSFGGKDLAANDA